MLRIIVNGIADVTRVVKEVLTILKVSKSNMPYWKKFFASIRLTKIASNNTRQMMMSTNALTYFTNSIRAILIMPKNYWLWTYEKLNDRHAREN